MSSKLPDKDWELQLERMCFDLLSEAEQEALAVKIAEDEEVLNRYIETVHMREGLPYLLSDWPTTSDESQTLEPFDPKGHLSSTPATENSPSTHKFKRLQDNLFRRHHNSWLSGWVQAASVAFIAGACLMSAVHKWQAANDGMSDGNFSQLPLAPVSHPEFTRFRNDTLGRISGLSPDACNDVGLLSMQVGQELKCGEVVQLSTGYIRVQLQADVECILQGPTEFSLVGPNSIFVRKGQLSAIGMDDFTLQTPLLTFECQQAVAAFEVTDIQSAKVYLEEGSITLHSTPREGFASEQLKLLRPGRGLLATSNGKTGAINLMAATRWGGVAWQWSDVERQLSDYERVVLSDDPVAYWPLQNVRRNRRVLDLTQNGYDGLAIGNWPVDDTSQPSTEMGTYFNGESYIEPDHKPSIDPRKGITIEGWAKVMGGPEFQSIFTSRWVLNSLKPDCQCFGFTLYAGDTDHWEMWMGSGVPGELWQKVISPNPIERGRWNHVAATFEPTGPAMDDELVPGKVILYVNGQPVAEDTMRASLKDFAWPARIGAAEFVPRYLTSWLFEGNLSDVAVYSYPLDAATIKRHFELRKKRISDAISETLRIHRNIVALVKGVFQS